MIQKFQIKMLSTKYQDYLHVCGIIISTPKENVEPTRNFTNYWLESRIIREELKISTIISILKVANSQNIADFRPINTLCTMDKLIETVVYDKILEFVEINNIGVKQHFNMF